MKVFCRLFILLTLFFHLGLYSEDFYDGDFSCFENEKIAVVPDQIIVESQGIFVVDDSGEIFQASAIISTPEGLFAFIVRGQKRECKECGRLMLGFYCKNEKCPLYLKRQ